MEFRGVRQTIIYFFVTVCCLTDLGTTSNDVNPVIVEDQFHVGVILDMGSQEGKIVLSCISMALLDFYRLHNNYSTRVVLHSKDSKGEPLHALSAALSLLENMKVEAIIGAQKTAEANLLAELGETAKLPIMSLSRRITDTMYPFFVEIIRDKTAEVKGISALIEVFKWRDVIILCDSIEYEREFIPSLVNSIKEISNGSVAYKSTNIALSSTNEEIIEELQKLMKLKSRVFVVHVSTHLLVGRLFLNAKKLGMLGEGYSWIMTSTSINFLHAMDLSVTESMQGVLGFKSSIPASTNLHRLTSRLRRKFYPEETSMEAIRELSEDGIRAYDATWALAEAVERARIKYSLTRSGRAGAVLLGEILHGRLKGLSGEIQYLNGYLVSSEPFEVVNIVGKGKIKRIGVWPCQEEGKSRKESPQQHLNRRNLGSMIDLEKIIWPGGSKRELSSSEEIKLRVVVPVKYGFREFVSVDHDPETNATHVTGFSIDVFKAAIGALPYKVHYEFIPFGNAIGNIPAGTYNDLVHQVYLKKFDAAVGDITITSNRSQYVDFTIPYTKLGVGMLVAIEKENMWIFFRPLSVYLWITSAAFFILTGFVVWIIEHSTNKSFQGTPSQQIGTIFWFSFSTLVYAHREKLLTNLAKFVVIIWVFVVLILTSTYTATLASMMTVKQIQSNEKENNIGYQSGALGVIVNLNFTGIKPYRSAEEYAFALSQGSKRGGVSGIIDEIPYINVFLAKYPADYSMIKTKSITNGFAFVFPKGSKLAQDVSRQIEHLRQEEKLIEMEKKWFVRKTAIMGDDDNTKYSDPNTIDLYDFRGLFLISGASLAIALFLFVVLSHRFRNLIRVLRIRLAERNRVWGSSSPT